MHAHLPWRRALSYVATCGTLYLYTTAHILTGLLNTLSGAYCFKAKAAIQANKPIASASGMAVPVQGQMIAPM